MTLASKKYYDYIPAIDALRFLIFLIILINHTDINRDVNGHSFFYTLTGFIITYISVNEIIKTKSFYFKRYVVRRLFRTLPLFFLLVSIVFAAKYFGYKYFDFKIQTAPIWSYFLVIHNYFTQNVTFPLGNMWALGITEQAYLLFGLLFIVFKKSPFWAGILLTILGVGIDLSFYYVFNMHNDAHTYQYLTCFGLGSLLAFFSVSKHPLKYKIVNLQRLSSYLVMLVGLALVAFGYFASYTWVFPFKYIFLSLGYCIVIFNVSFSNHKLFDLTNANSLQNIGRKTYGLYCIHAPVLTTISLLDHKYVLDLSPYTYFTATLFITIPIAHFSYHFFEKRFMNKSKLLY